MAFTAIGKFIAIFGFFLGAAMIFMGFYPIEEGTPGGHMIDKGIYLIVFSTVIGILTEISQAVAKDKKDES